MMKINVDIIRRKRDLYLDGYQYILKFWIFEENYYKYKLIFRKSINKINDSRKLKKVFLDNAKYKYTFCSKEHLEFDEPPELGRKSLEIDDDKCYLCTYDRR